MTLKSLIPALGFALVALSGTVPSDSAAKAECDYACPTHGLEFRDALPLSSAGKVLKTVLREPFWSSAARQVN